MPRINIEDSLFKDRRYINLILLVGDADKALGMIVNAWVVAQVFWMKNKSPIPEKEFAKHSLSSALIECGLATKNEDGSIYMRGSEKQFSWLKQRQESGRKGGLKSKRNSLSVAKRGKAGLSGSKRGQPSSSFSSSFSSSVSDCLNPATPPPPTAPAPSANSTESPTTDSGRSESEEVSKAIAIFCQEYKRRYSVNYRMTGKDVGIIKRMLSSVGLPVFERLCVAYVDMPDQWFLTRRHDLVTFESSFAKVSQFEQSGRTITRAEIDQIDRRQANANVFEKLIAEQKEKEKQNGKQ